RFSPWLTLTRLARAPTISPKSLDALLKSRSQRRYEPAKIRLPSEQSPKLNGSPERLAKAKKRPSRFLSRSRAVLSRSPIHVRIWSGRIDVSSSSQNFAIRSASWADADRGSLYSISERSEYCAFE